MLTAAWCGAALFVVSLSYFAYFYLVRLGQAVAVPAEAVPRAVAADVVLFTLFAAHHSVFARTGAKAWVLRHLPRGLERAAYVWLASLLFLAVCWLWQPLPGVAWHATGAARWLLYLVQLAGVVLTLKSASRIDIWDLSGVGQARAATNPAVSPAESAQSVARSAALAAPASPVASPAPSELEVGGPYRWVRHPIYFGWVLLVFGSPTMTTGRLLFATISTLYLVVAIPFEERSLRNEFGPAYTSYQQQVRWRLVPGLW